MERNSNYNTKGGGGEGLLLRSGNSNHHHIEAAVAVAVAVRPPETTSSDFVLQWGNRKRSRCMKFHVKDRDNNNNTSTTNNQDPTNPSGSQQQPPIQRAMVRVDRRSDRIKDSAGHPSYYNNNNGDNGVNNGYLNLRQRSASPSPRILRNSESSVAMRGQSNGVRGLTSPDRGGDRKGNNGAHCNGNKHGNSNGNIYSNNVNGGSAASSDSKKGGGGTSSGSDAIPVVWPPKFAITLTTKEKEEDFMAIKGSKLPQRPKKRAKLIQRTLNLVSPGAWLCDLTLDRYEVREKKVSKKRPRGLRAMGNVDSESE